MVPKKFVKYGGIKFENNVPVEEINDFVKGLPPEKKDSLFEVVKELDSAGLITLDASELTTVDLDTIDWQR